MTRINRINLETTIYKLWRTEIMRQGYFDDWLSDSGIDSIAMRIRNKTGYNIHKIKRIYWKNFKPNEKIFLDNYIY